jgi:anti-anti-sigma factor
MAHLQLVSAGPPSLVRLLDAGIDETNVYAVEEELTALVDDAGLRELCLDFGKVSYLTSTGLAKLVALHNRLRAEGGSLALCNVSPRIYELFEVTRLTQLFDVRPAGGDPDGGPVTE